MTSKEQLDEIEQKLRFPGKLTVPELRFLLKQKEDLTRTELLRDSRALTGLDDNSTRDTRSLHELLMLQKELNYLKRQVSKAIRAAVASQQAEDRQRKVTST